MKWRDGELKSPFSGKLLRRDSPHSFSDGKRRFPVIAEVPFLRGGRDELSENALRLLDSGQEREALILLLREQDDWARTAPPAPEDLQPLFEDKNITLRAAMECLKYGAVADYFAYRWSDPTFLSGLKLLETHFAPRFENVCELACGIGHFLREFDRQNVAAVGVDVVFSKLWLARRFVASRAKLVCADANYDLPFADKVFDAAFCHDAFYFLPEKQRVADELKRTTRDAILIGHAHNSDAANYSSGAAIPVADYAQLIGGEAFYDDAELTAALIEKRAPRAQSVDELNKTEAVSLATNAPSPEGLRSFLVGADWRINPLLIDENENVRRQPRYPSERYENEYAALSGYLNLSENEAQKLTEFSRSGNLSADEIEDFARRRILLDLPENW